MNDDIFDMDNIKPEDITQDMIAELHSLVGIDAVSAFAKYLLQYHSEELVMKYKKELRIYYDQFRN